MSSSVGVQEACSALSALAVRFGISHGGRTAITAHRVKYHCNAYSCQPALFSDPLQQTHTNVDTCTMYKAPPGPWRQWLALIGTLIALVLFAPSGATTTAAAKLKAKEAATEEDSNTRRGLTVADSADHSHQESSSSASTSSSSAIANSAEPIEL
ncbi:hypothetical protein BGZ95_005403 [Linnemannia exigua]|uniref:Uncharacterized protein n=1 Tax=Linnemannia exigua TaxID=604196 RepID=A0AAD4DLH7_9FUNG|nr:hypothetical protein BGZ95_005403 [Linnemannia exigua]